MQNTPLLCSRNPPRILFCNVFSSCFRKMLFYISSLVRKNICPFQVRQPAPKTLSGIVCLTRKRLFHSGYLDVICFCFDRKIAVIDHNTNKKKPLKVVVNMSHPVSVQPKNQTDLDVLMKLDLIDSDDMEEVSEFLDKLLSKDKYEERREAGVEYVAE